MLGSIQRGIEDCKELISNWKPENGRLVGKEMSHKYLYISPRWLWRRKQHWYTYVGAEVVVDAGRCTPPNLFSEKEPRYIAHYSAKLIMGKGFCFPEIILKLTDRLERPTPWTKKEAWAWAHKSILKALDEVEIHQNEG